MIVTIIMILTDWLMVGVTKMVYSCKVAYRQGMLFGVHVPGDAAELPEVWPAAAAAQLRLAAEPAEWV